MDTVRIVWGTATGPTELAAYDAALRDANVHDYNLVTVSSVIPPDATVEVVGTAPDLGRAGNRLTVVQARLVAPGPVAAGLAWATGEGAGILYEASGAEEAAVRETLETGLAAGCDLRDRTLDEREFRTISAQGESGAYAAAVVLATFGESEPI